MITTEIKKALYKEKPFARRAGIIEHKTTKERTHIYFSEPFDFTRLVFEVPESEMGETIFEASVPAQLLIRWLKIF